MRGYTYYKINNVDCRICEPRAHAIAFLVASRGLRLRAANPDQLLTNDCKQFCQSVTDLFQNTLKPFLDMTVFAR